MTLGMKNPLIATILLLSSLGQSQDKETKCSVKKELVEFVNEHFQNLSDKGYFVVSEVLSYNELVKRGNGWNDFLKPKTFTMMRKLSIKNKADQIDFTTFFSEEDFEYMKCQLRQNAIDNWKQLMPKGFFHKADSVLEKVRKKNKLKSNRDSINNRDVLLSSGKFRWFSIPLFNKDHNYAIVYQQTSGSGSLLVFEKQDDDWDSFATLLIWIQ